MTSKMNKFVYSLSKILQYVYYVLFKILQKHSSLLSRVVSPAPLFVSTVRFSLFLYTVMIRSSLLHLPPLLRVTLARLFAHGELPASVRSCTLLVLYARSLFGFVQGPAFGRLFQAGVRLPRLLLVTGKLLPEVRGFRRSATLKSVCEETDNASGVHSSIWFPMINSNFEVEERDNEKDVETHCLVCIHSRFFCFTKVKNEQCFTTDVRTIIYEAYSWGFRLKINQLHRTTGTTSAKTLFQLVYTQSRFFLLPNQSHNNVTRLQFLQSPL